MTTEENKAVVRRFNKEFIEAGNMNSFNEIMAADFIDRTAPPGSPEGPQGVVYFFNNLLKSGFPEIKVEIHEQVAEGDKVTTRKTFHTTHKGNFFGVPASNRPVKIDVIDIIHLRNGKFVEHWGAWDMQNVIMQITG